MDIAIIGSGTIGSALAHGLAAAGHDVRIAGRNAATLEEVAGRTGARVARSITEAVRGSQVIVLALPWDAAEAIAEAIGADAAGKVVVDVTNPATPDWSAPRFLGSASAAERLAATLPGAHVVKAFNTILGSNLAAGRGRGGIRLDALVAGDEPAAKAAVLGLAADLGFDPIDAGPLANAGLLEAVAWLNISLNMANGWPWQSGWKLVGAPAALEKVAA